MERIQNNDISHVLRVLFCWSGLQQTDVQETFPPNSRTTVFRGQLCQLLLTSPLALLKCHKCHSPKHFNLLWLQLSGFGRRHNSAITFKSLAFWVLLPAFQPLTGSIEPGRGTWTPAAMLPGSRRTPTTTPLPSSSRGSATHLPRQNWQGVDVNH